MFSTSEAPNPLDASIVKATDESLVTDNWEYIIDVCDCVNDDPENGASNAIAAITKRLQVNNANILLRSLSLILSLAENCGSKMKQEISSHDFTDLLFKLIENKAIHYTIKVKLIEIMNQLSQSFKNDPSLKYMEITYSKVKREYSNLTPEGTTAPVASTAPSQPAAQNEDDDDLQAALKASLDAFNSEEKFRKSKTNSVQQPVQETPAVQPVQLPVQEDPVQPAVPHQIQPQPTEEAAPAVNKVIALYDFSSAAQDQLSFKKGDVIIVLENIYKDWWRGSLNGRVGIFPLNYVTLIKEPSKEELLKDIELEYTIGQETRNIERLLVKLQSLNSSEDPAEILNASNDEYIQTLYNNITPLRPKVTKLIDKYSKKKEELITLDTKLTDAEKKYNDLMDAAVSKYQGSHQYPSYTGTPTYYPQGQQPVQASQPSQQPYQAPVQQPYQAPPQQPYQAPAQQPASQPQYFQQPQQSQPQQPQLQQPQPQQPPPQQPQPQQFQPQYPPHQLPLSNLSNSIPTQNTQIPSPQQNSTGYHNQRLSQVSITNPLTNLPTGNGFGNETGSNPPYPKINTLEMLSGANASSLAPSNTSSSSIPTNLPAADPAPFPENTSVFLPKPREA